MNDRVVIVSGGAGGIGSAICADLTKRGATAVSLDLVSAGGPDDVVVDVSSPSGVEAAVRSVSERFGRIDGLVCAAGVVSEAPLADLEPDEWARVLGINLTSVYLLARAARPFLARDGAGAIVAFSSGWARRGYPNGSHYAASKAGVEGLVRSLALELAPEGIRVNAIAPGPVETAFLDQLPDPEATRARAAVIPLGRLGRPEDLIALTALLLNPDESGWTTGQVIQVNGGLFLA